MLQTPLSHPCTPYIDPPFLAVVIRFAHLGLSPYFCLLVQFDATSSLSQIHPLVLGPTTPHRTPPLKIFTARDLRIDEVLKAAFAFAQRMLSSKEGLIERCMWSLYFFLSFFQLFFSQANQPQLSCFIAARLYSQ